MPNTEYDVKLAVLFDKLDKLTEKFNDHDKWAGAQSAKIEGEIKHIELQIEEIKEEYRISQKEIHVVAESGSEERFRLKEELAKKTTEAKFEMIDLVNKEKIDAIKSANAYSNRGVAIAIGVVTLLFGLIEAVYYIHELIKTGGH